MAFEWCITDYFDPKNQEHHKIKAEIEIGDGLPDIRYTRQCLEALKQAGFELMAIAAEPDFSVLGKRLGKSLGVVAKEVKAMTQGDILAFEKASWRSNYCYTLLEAD
ncbi:isoleucine--tRNA ligase, cytoplasmic-like isoform X2 [Pistacia vera]|uniref:isoleucine--tRNA ligase, cytoplasmic-like isoform X2 n=1 Tax=Pistacia vera TaxID=55513 RepID=UPI001263284F|nr:isoleucine--tRNA ligase, cytoplasmic-like isoform X2 [Pistacia vera]